MRIPYMPVSRDVFVQRAAVVSALAAALSLVAAFVLRAWFPMAIKSAGYTILAAWALGPPLYFWAEWVTYSAKFDTDLTGKVKHLHDLSSRIWVALVIVLAAMLGVSWPP